MKNFFKFLGIIALAAVIGFGVMACEEEQETDGKAVITYEGAKSITITGITGKTGDAMIYVLSSYDDDGIVAMGMGSISGNSVTFNLITDTYASYTGSGSYYLMFGFDIDDSTYFYTDGQTFAQLGINFVSDTEAQIIAKLPKYSISSASSTIAFSKFIEAPDW